MKFNQAIYRFLIFYLWKKCNRVLKKPFLESRFGDSIFQKGVGFDFNVLKNVLVENALFSFSALSFSIWDIYFSNYLW